VTVSDDEAHERVRASAEEAARTATEHAKAERLKAEMLTGPMSQEVLRQ
jgi:hypothetical protein